MQVSIMKIIDSTTVDGPGLRTSVYAAGCGHRCPGCHNPQSWDEKAGKTVSTDEVAAHILRNGFENVTFSGGDPMFQAVAFTEIAKTIKVKSGKNIWCYTGFRFEQLLSNPAHKALLNYIDVLVDGRFEEHRRNTDLLFRGSSNQRLIDVKASLRKGEAVQYNMQIICPSLAVSLSI